MESLMIRDDERGAHPAGPGNVSFDVIPVSKCMDSDIWNNLPDHILDHICSFLPFWSILQLQSVSRKWRKTLKSPDFLAKRSTNLPSEVLFCMFTDRWHIQSAAAYNPSLNKWHLIPLSHFGREDCARDFHVITAAGGLLCTEEVAWPHRSLAVCNPFNRSYRKLPPMLDMKSPYVVGMTVNADRSGYRLLVAQDGEPLVSQHYDSKSDSWKMNVTLGGKVAMLAGMASTGGFLFCLSFWPLGLIAYNINEATWFNTQVVMPPAIGSPHLIHNRGQLFLVGGLEEYGIMTCIKIWRVDLDAKECVEVEQMPEHFFHKLSWTVGGEHFSCVGDAGFVCFSDGLMPAVLMYDMEKKIWWWLPPCPLYLSSPKYLSKYAHNSLNPLGFPVQPCFLVRA